MIPFIIAVPGLIAVVKFSEPKDGDQAFPELVAVLLPAGLRGVFLAAFIAALMSSIDSYLNSAAAIVANDLYKRFIRPAAEDGHILWVGRIATLGLVIWAVGFAFMMRGTSTGIYAIFQTLMAFFQGPALAILLTGLFWRRATRMAAFFGFVTGVLFSISLFALDQEPVYTWLGLKPLFKIAEPFLYFSIWAFLLTLFLIVTLSLLTMPEPDEKTRHTIVAQPRNNQS